MTPTPEDLAKADAYLLRFEIVSPGMSQVLAALITEARRERDEFPAWLREALQQHDHAEAMAGLLRFALDARDAEPKGCPHGSTGPCSVCGDQG
jgi:hypothetical protein